MELLSIIKKNIGHKVSIKTDTIFITEDHDYSCYNNDIYICFSTNDNINYYKIKHDFYDFEDEFDNIINGKIDDEFPLRYPMETKYMIKPIEMPAKEYEKLPVSFSNSYFNLLEVEAYQKKIGKNKAEFDKLNDKYNFSPELYILKFDKNKELIIFFNLNGPTKKIFYEKAAFLNYISSWYKLTLNDFDRIIE
jgi:hypothetical protein